MKINLKKKGFSTVELLIYSAGMVIILTAIIYILFQIYTMYNFLTIGPRADRVGISIIDRITKDIRSGDQINLSESQFNTITGNLTINSFENGSPVTKKFNYDNGRISYKENSGASNFISPQDISVTRFYLSQATSTISQAVRVELDITYEIDKKTHTNTYTGFSILRHSYE